MPRLIATMLLILAVNSPTVAAPLLEPATDADTLVLEYSHDIPMLADREAIPLLRIYGDGTMWVRPGHPARSSKQQIDKKTLHGLLNDMHDAGLLKFDAKAVAGKREQRLRSARQLIHISDDTISVIRVKLARYGEQTPFSKTIRWANVRDDARWLPLLAEIQALNRFEQQLIELLEANKTRGAGE